MVCMLFLTVRVLFAMACAIVAMRSVVVALSHANDVEIRKLMAVGNLRARGVVVRKSTGGVEPSATFAIIAC